MKLHFQVFFLLIFCTSQWLYSQNPQRDINPSISLLSEEGDGGVSDINVFKNRVVPVFMIIAGLGMAGIWAADIAGGKFADRGSFFKWREGENLLWPHILAETLTAAGLITGGFGLYHSQSWAINVSLVSLGALTYSAINSSAWVLAEKERLPYGIPMWVSLAGAGISIAILIN